MTPDFSQAVWFEAIPQVYGQKHGVSYEEARRIVEAEYEKVGDQRLEWYDVGYWFDYFGLGTPAPVLKDCQVRVRYYPEVFGVLETLSQKYELIVASGSSREFLSHLLKDVEFYFTKVFSSISDYKQLKTRDFYLEMCRKLGISPHQIVHVGDNRQFDFDIPRQVGIQAFHLDRRRQTKPDQDRVDFAEIRSGSFVSSLKQFQCRLIEWRRARQ